MLPCQFSLYCKLSFAYLRGFANCQLFACISSTLYPYYSSLLLGCKRRLLFYRQSGRGFYPCCHSRGFILHLDLPSRQNTQIRGSVLLLLIYYLPRLHGWPMRCSCFLLYPSFLVIFWRESSSEVDSKGRCRRSR